MHKMRKVVLAAVLLAGAAAPAAADIVPLDDTAWYLGFDAGPTFVPETSATINGAGVDIDFDPGFALRGEVGYAFGPSLRAGLELGWRGNDVDSISGGLGGAGGLDAISLMGNFTYQVPTGSALVPYVGGGVGGARLKADGLAGLVDDSDLVFAYQARAGVDYALNPRTSIGLGYAYFGTEEADFADGANRAQVKYGGHSLMLGMTFRLGPEAPAPQPRQTTPPPPPEPPKAEPAPPPEPAPAPRAEVQVMPATFLVFFDWNRSDIKADGRPVIEEAAEHYASGGFSIIELVGHADRSGPRDYNMALSRRRAESVAEALIEGGVPADAITINARGEDDPLVPTPDGVREPRNRRVEILIP